jgi:hypothetical protein
MITGAASWRTWNAVKRGQHRPAPCRGGCAGRPVDRMSPSIRRTGRVAAPVSWTVFFPDGIQAITGAPLSPSRRRPWIVSGHLMRPVVPDCRGGTGCMSARHCLSALPSRGHRRDAGAAPCRPGWNGIRRPRTRRPGERTPATTRRGHLRGRLCRCRGSSRPGHLDRRLGRCRVVATCRGLGGCPDTADPPDRGEPPDQTAVTALTDRHTTSGRGQVSGRQPGPYSGTVTRAWPGGRRQ